MKLLTAARGGRLDDWCTTEPGEVVWSGPVCEAAEEDPDACPCSRAFWGINGTGSTTLAVVADVVLTRDQLAARLRSGLGLNRPDVDAETLAEADDAVAEMQRHGAALPLGARVRRAPDHVYLDGGARGGTRGPPGEDPRRKGARRLRPGPTKRTHTRKAASP